MSPRRGWNIGGRMPLRQVPCTGWCGTVLERRAYYHRALCSPCRKIKRLDEGALRKEQARRFRILMHVMGFEESEFAEALEALKASDLAYRDEPETRAARIDATVEKRNARAKRKQKERRSPHKDPEGDIARAVRAGERTAGAIASDFGVSVRTVERIKARCVEATQCES